MNAPPLSLKRELRGRIVVLDFWTYCCINWCALRHPLHRHTAHLSICESSGAHHGEFLQSVSPLVEKTDASPIFQLDGYSMHVLPELANLEKKWADSPITVVSCEAPRVSCYCITGQHTD